MNGDDSLQNKSKPTYGRKMKNLYMCDGYFLIVYRIQKQPYWSHLSLCPRVEPKRQIDSIVLSEGKDMVLETQICTP
jgi:hypothetical protein